MKQAVVNNNDANQRLDKFLSKMLCKMPLSLLQKSIRKGRVRINGKKISDPKFTLSVGDVLSLYINDEFFETDASQNDFLNCTGNIQIVYEDENILLVNKPVNLAVHEYEGATCDTLINRIKKYLYDKGEYDYKCENSFVPSLCNRIDRNTCGIVIAAKNAPTLRLINDKIKQRCVEKKYLCLCHGKFKSQGETLTLYMKKNESENRVTVSKRPLPEHKTAITVYKVLKQIGDNTLLEITLKTGRTHQIRACMAYIGHPLLGDGKYGTGYHNDKLLGYPYQALCSYYVKFKFNKDEHLFYLNDKTFSVSDIWFIK